MWRARFGGGTEDGAVAYEYSGDHLDFRAGEFKGPVIAKVSVHQHAAAPTALDALPARTAGFIGRGSELSRLLNALDPAIAEGPHAVLVAAVSGLGGIGKTALAVEAAHAACDKGWFPGGVLFVNLQGYADDRVTADQALEALLRALGTKPDHIPATADQRAGLYRSILTERGRERGAVLILADNAALAEQVRPLLPGGGARHRVLVTSRDRLPQLGARIVPLGQLTPSEASGLLDRVLRIADPDDCRIADETSAAAKVAACCGYLPLALQIAGALLVLDRSQPVAELAAELGEFRDRLDRLDDGERSVRAAFELSYRLLAPDEARLLRLLALAPGPEASAEVVTALIGAKELPTRALNALARAHLVERGSGRERWRMHDLVRAFGLVADADLPDEREAARDRVLDIYWRRAHAADARLRWLRGMPEPPWFGESAEALAWFDAERLGLIAVVGWAEEKRYESRAVLLAACLVLYLERQRHFDDWITVSSAARNAARRLGDPDREAGASNNLGNALRKVGKVAEAIDAHTHARDFFQAVGEHRSEAVSWNNLGLDLLAAGREDEAIEALTRARDLFQVVGDAHLEAVAWDCLGVALSQMGRVADSIEVTARARDLFRIVGDFRREAGAENNLGAALIDAGRTEEAIESFESAREIFRELGDWYWTGQVLYNLALCHEAHQHSTEAVACWVQASEAYTRAGAVKEAAEALALAEEQE